MDSSISVEHNYHSMQLADVRASYMYIFVVKFTRLSQCMFLSTIVRLNEEIDEKQENLREYQPRLT